MLALEKLPNSGESYTITGVSFAVAAEPAGAIEWYDLFATLSTYNELKLSGMKNKGLLTRDPFPNSLRNGAFDNWYIIF